MTFSLKVIVAPLLMRESKCKTWIIEKHPLPDFSDLSNDKEASLYGARHSYQHTIRSLRSRKRRRWVLYPPLPILIDYQ